MIPVPYSADLPWRFIWFVHILQNSVAEVSFSLGVCERTVERYISKFLVNGGVKPEPVGRSYGSMSFAPREELFFFCIPVKCKDFTISGNILLRYIYLSVHQSLRRTPCKPKITNERTSC